MQRSDMAASQHTQIAELMETLASLQFKMSRVKNMFPTYHQHLQHTYNQMLIQARKSNILPPWMIS